MGHITPTAMIPVTFDANTGEMMPGQTFGTELSRPGTSEANAMVTTSGRYVVQKAELSTLFFYYMLQGNYNFFNQNEAAYDDIDAQQRAEIEEMSGWMNPFGFFQPIDEQGVVPDAWKVAQPMSGLAIYEPVSMKRAARNQAEMGEALVGFSLEHLCLQEGCRLEEAAARLGYASWNLEQAFLEQLGEASEDGEVSPGTRSALGARAQEAVGACRAARERVLAGQPALPTEQELVVARGHAEACGAALRQIVAELQG